MQDRIPFGMPERVRQACLLLACHHLMGEDHPVAAIRELLLPWGPMPEFVTLPEPLSEPSCLAN